jgi:L-threonylcarbamoyladenylate synthase
MKILSLDQHPLSTIIAETIQVLESGGLVIFPTETVYGAGVDALNQTAVDKLLAYKSRREGKPLSIAVTDLQMAEKYVEVNEQAKTIYERFLPGPVTVVSKGKGVVANGVESEFGTLGIRIPAYPLILDLIQQYEKPMTSTSANGSGEKRPYTIQDIFDGLSEKQKSLIDLVIDAGQLPPNPPSTVIDTTLSTPVVFRQGDIQIGQTNQVTELRSNSETETKDIAKRMILKHWNEVKETGLVIGLNGSLGMGKTVFTKGVAEFLNISETITSPTYTYMEEYEFNRHGFAGKLFHLDVWRIEKNEEMEKLQFPTLLHPGRVIIIEWSQHVAEYLQSVLQQHHIPYLEVNFSEVDTSRLLQIKE